MNLLLADIGGTNARLPLKKMIKHQSQILNI